MSPEQRKKALKYIMFLKKIMMAPSRLGYAPMEGHKESILQSQKLALPQYH